MNFTCMSGLWVWLSCCVSIPHIFGCTFYTLSHSHVAHSATPSSWFRHVTDQHTVGTSVEVLLNQLVVIAWLVMADCNCQYEPEVSYTAYTWDKAVCVCQCTPYHTWCINHIQPESTSLLYKWLCIYYNNAVSSTVLCQLDFMNNTTLDQAVASKHGLITPLNEELIRLLLHWPVGMLPSASN